MHNKKLTLTIVIPAYNEELYLPACLRAITKQTVKPNEVIVVNNKSTDRTQKIIDRHPFVRGLKEAKIGVINSRDKGFNKAKSDIIARIDADTLISKDWVARLHKVFADKNVSAVAGPIGLYDIPLARFNYIFDHLMRRYIYMFGPKNKKPFLSGPNMAIRKTAWQKVSKKLCRDKLTHEDIDIAIHLAKDRRKIVYDSKLRASVSTRRYNDSFKSFRYYMKMFDFTYRYHELHGVRIHSASIAYWLGYILVHPLRKPLAILNGLFNKNIPYDIKPRKNPN